MSEQHLPTEQQLDILLEQTPQYDLAAVKRRTLSRVEAPASPPVRKARPFRGILIAAVILAMSASAVTAADYATGGKITRALGFQKPQTKIDSPVIPEAVPEPSLIQEHPENTAPPPPELPEEPPVQPPELDTQIAEALQVPPSQAQQLRPAVQSVDKTAEDQHVRMTVLQTLGDPSCLNIKLRFDFPVEVPTSQEFDFEDFDVSFSEAGSFSMTRPVLERTETSLTYLMRIYALCGTFSGQTATVSIRNYGRPLELPGDSTMLQTKVGEKKTILVDPEGNTRTSATPEDIAALSGVPDSMKTTEDGFTITYMSDGSFIVDYDGAHGVRYVLIQRNGDTPVILTGENPKFDAVLAGSWTQSWELSYEDTSVSWQGEQVLFDPSLTMKSFRISPLSWEAVFDGNELASMILPKSWENVQLRRSDGSLTDLPLKRSSASPRMVGYRCTLTVGHMFDQPIDLSDVTAILIDGIEFPLS